MNDDELEARLRATLRERASRVSSRPDAWDGYAERTPIASTSSPTAGRRMVWLGVAAAAALVVFVIVQVTSSPSVKVTAIAPETTDTGVSSIPSTTVVSTTVPAPTTTPPTVPAGPAGSPVPALFAPSSVTFVSLHTGWVLGTAPCGNTICNELLRTRDGGKTWVALPPPSMPVADTSGIRRRIRFANLNDGWIFGPDLWVTHDGGATWNRPSIQGLAPDTPVTALETDGKVVHAVFISTAPDVTVVTSPVGHDEWRAAPVTIPIGAGPVPAAQLVVQGAGGWIIENNRTVVGGARLERGQWVAWRSPCADKGGSAVTTASTPTDVVVVCNEGVWTGGSITQNVFVSSDGGTTFHEIAPPIASNWQVDGVASAGPDAIVVGGVTPDGSRVLEATFDGGHSWSAAYTAPAHGSWSDLGFSGPTQGIGVAHHEGGDQLLMTTDGGHHWNPTDFYAGH